MNTNASNVADNNAHRALDFLDFLAWKKEAWREKKTSAIEQKLEKATFFVFAWDLDVNCIYEYT